MTAHVEIEDEIAAEIEDEIEDEEEETEMRIETVQHPEPITKAANHDLDARLRVLFDPYPDGEAALTAAEFTRTALSARARGFAAYSSEGDERAGFYDTQIPDVPEDVADYFSRIGASAIVHAPRMDAPRVLGHMTSSVPRFQAELARLICSMNLNLVKHEASGAFTFLERQSLAMLHRLVFGCAPAFYSAFAQSKAHTLGISAGGATAANLTALWCARNRRLGPRGDFAGIEAEGLEAALIAHGLRDAVILASPLAHYSIAKSAGILGLGKRRLLSIPVDQTGSVDAEQLSLIAAECEESGRAILAIVGIAGTTDTGAIDPLSEMADIAHQHDTHFHVDAAWGGPVLFSRAHRRKLAGIERADSVTFDAHKQLYAPIGFAALLLRDPSLAADVEQEAAYMIRPDSWDLGRRSLEGSRPASALHVHAALHLIGRHGFERLIDSSIDRASYMAHAVRARGDFELMVDPALNIVVYRYCSHAPQKELDFVNAEIQRVQAERGKAFVSRTTVLKDGVPALCLRAVLANPSTHRTDIDAVLEEQASIGRAVLVQRMKKPMQERLT